MTLGDLVPWGRKDRSLTAPAHETSYGGFGEVAPFLRLHEEMNRLFDDAFRSFEPLAGRAWSAAWPHLEVEETEGAYQVIAELPGLDEKDVEVAFSDGELVIRGEKRSDANDNGRRVSERFYGRFERRIALPDIDEEKAEARFDKGVLTLTLPKSPTAQARVKRIPINGRTTH
jgi:HSP20 family protein